MNAFGFLGGKWRKKQAEKVRKEFDCLNNTAAEAQLDENFIQAPLRIYEEGFLDESTNANLLREILPIITRGNNLLRGHANLMEEREQVASEVKILLGKINEVAAKKRDLEKAFQKIESADLNTLRSYCLFNDEQSGDVILMSNAVNSKNMVMTSKHLYPAVITVHTLTNEVMSYDIFDELAGSGDYPIKRAELDAKISKMSVNACNGMESVEEMKQIAFAMLEQSAAKIQALYDQKNAELGTLLEEQTLSPFDQARILAETIPNEDGLSVSLRKLSNCVMIQNRENYSTLTLWYSEEGITGAYFSNSAGMAQRVYDVREFHKGFLNLDAKYQDDYLKLLKSDALKKFLGIEKMELSMAAEKVPVYWLGQTKHTSDEVLNGREPMYSGSAPSRDEEWTDNARMESLKERLRTITDKYQEIINKARISKEENEDFVDIELDYNVYNHSIGLTRGNDRVVVQYADNFSIKNIFIKDISDRLLKKGKAFVVNETFQYGMKDLYCSKELDYINDKIEKPKFYDSIAKELGFPPYAEKQMSAVKESSLPQAAIPKTAPAKVPESPGSKKPILAKKPALKSEDKDSGEPAGTPRKKLLSKEQTR